MRPQTDPVDKWISEYCNEYDANISLVEKAKQIDYAKWADPVPTRPRRIKPGLLTRVLRFLGLSR